MRFKLRFTGIRLLPFLASILFCNTIFAQPKAEFVPDKTAGCSPLFVSFSNTTTGISADAVYLWDFGNGNTSSLQHPGAVFYEEKTYTVSLTVTDGAQTSTQSKTITVYKRPVIDFIATPPSGCLPMPVNFTITASPGSGSITNYQWDFGDGNTLQSLGLSVPHTYDFLQTATVSLTAINSFGCSNTIVKDNLITTHPPVQAAFVADKTVICGAPGTVQFTNNTSGPGTLSYEWDFGDGNTSVEAAPAHTYGLPGIYTVKLTARSSTGCSHVSVRNAYINVAAFNTDFAVPALMCTGNYISFSNTSTPSPGLCTWVFDGADTYTSFGNSSMPYVFGSDGTHTVQLTAAYGNCRQTVTKNITVKNTPLLNGFIADPQGLCGAPIQVNFRDTTAGAVSWKWNFDWYTNNSAIHSTIQAPSHTYTNDKDYYVSLTVTNADGCSANIRRSVNISRPIVGIFLDPDSKNEGCGQLTAKFNARTTDGIVSYAWNFGDGSPVSNEAQPVHTFNQTGIFTVSLTYTTVNGCTGTVTYNSITVRVPAKADFSVDPVVCGQTQVQFINKSTGYLMGFEWNFGDNFISFDSHPKHRYWNEAEYTVRLIAKNGICNDTIVKTNIIKVLPPFPRIGTVANTCEGMRDKVTFIDGSKQTDSWHWDFGDGVTTSYTTPVTSLVHSYSASGKYYTVLTGVNGACTVKDTSEVFVLLKQNPVLTVNASQVCHEGSTLNLRVSGLIRPEVPLLNPPPPPYYGYQVKNREWIPYVGAVNSSDWGSLPVGLTVAGFLYGDDTIRVISRSVYYGCFDTTNAVPVRAKGPRAQLERVGTNMVCFKSPLVFRDISETPYGIPIVKWEWNFGDGQTAVYNQGGIVTHQYANPGSYLVRIKVTDAEGCVSTSANYLVFATGPRAAFIVTPGNTVQLNTAITFFNVSNTTSTNTVTYLWDFGNGVTSTQHSPTYTFPAPGEYNVKLIAENVQTQCRDTAQQKITVKDFNSGFTKTVSFIGDHKNCPPVLAKFAVTATNYTRLVWNFGDGFTLENQLYPSHVYKAAGVFPVTLHVYGFNGLSAIHRDTVRVSMPQAVMAIDDADGCKGHQVTLNAPVHTDANGWIWDFGDGYTMSGTDTFAVHQYTSAGSFLPSLLVTDTRGCIGLTTLPERVIIYPDPQITITPAMPVVCKGNAVQLQASGADSYRWSPATGLSDASVSSPLALPANTTAYTVNATDVKGCTSDAAITVTVAGPFMVAGSTNSGVCKGSSVQLNMTGAASYTWINVTEGLSSIQVNNPVATPQNTITYTVVGYDEYHCYTDTVPVNVNVYPLPVVNAGADLLVAFGSENRLVPAASNDVLAWKWSPARYLDCATCSNPVSRPQSAIDYVVTVYNGNNCEAKDSISLKMVCAEANIYIPNAFTPNSDGKNDVFTINGHGVRIVKSLRIYNRWGELIFEKRNFFPGDIASAWNGKYKGIDADAGAYVYFAEMECEAGQVFQRKGTVTLVR